ncbi:YvcK family protein [Periweissella fabaria]|uniref:Putative gluconeogenesis factor n=1 Tax=Periweissella fabaria TaxID=546157 RepID=A0ABN8BIP6_9LACO|nr:uridine diphosphate-N-acetylglucosamine-binding protein YvcK [Periweissella fabaria]MCM0597966.1 YvcK family protein [Periweissella fabaria]CAH0417433.1 Putative gluconeogenesis factor [Periweissella fabaria]
MKKVVIIGGGSGLPVVLRALRKQKVDITAVVTVADDGGSSGVLRNYINVVPPGDIRNVMAVMSTLDENFINVFQYRFKSDDDFFAGHSIGNLIIAAMQEMNLNIFDAVQKLSKMMAIRGQVYPVANEPLELHAQFADGTSLVGEAEITHAHKVIKKVWVEPIDGSNNKIAQAVPQVITAIAEADQVILGPGSLYTSILPNLTIPDVALALRATRADIVYISNIMTQKGETDNFSDADHVKVLNEHLGGDLITHVIVNATAVPEDYIDWQHWSEVSQQVRHDSSEFNNIKAQEIQANLLELRDNGAFHNGNLVVEELMKILAQK